MEKKRSQRLTIVVSMAKKESDDAAIMYKKSRDQLNEETEKFQSLDEYYKDYSNPLPSDSCTAEQMARQSSFLGQIFEAKKQQERVVKQQVHIVEQYQIDWQKKHLKYNALLEMVERIEQEENKALSRKEEKLLDDWYLQTMSARVDQRQ